jgi:hypothetical protein
MFVFHIIYFFVANFIKCSGSGARKSEGEVDLHPKVGEDTHNYKHCSVYLHEPSILWLPTSFTGKFQKI